MNVPAGLVLVLFFAVAFGANEEGKSGYKKVRFLKLRDVSNSLYSFVNPQKVPKTNFPNKVLSQKLCRPNSQFTTVRQ